MITNFKLCNYNRYSHTLRSKSSIKFIVVHYTAGEKSPTVQNSLDYFARTEGRASAHFFVDENDVGASVPWNYPAWHCGSSTGYKHQSCRNYNSLGVELNSEEKNGNYWFTEKTLDRGAKFVAWLMKEYNVPLSNVVRHYDVTGKICPAPLIDSGAWNQFKVRVLRHLKATEEKEVEQVTQYYEKLEEIPETHKPAVEKLVKKGVLKGTGSGLHLSYDMLRIFTILDRAGAFD